jgi:hypothetical protein
MRRGDIRTAVLAVLSEAAGTDLTPMFTQEWGFAVRTRERQRGY